jgi:hypothetical protein
MFEEIGITFDVQADGFGHASFIGEYSGAQAQAIRIHKTFRGTTTRTFGPPLQFGSTSEFSPRYPLIYPPFNWDDDAKTDIAVYRPNTAGGLNFFYILNSHDNSFTAQQFGSAGDVLAIGEYNGGLIPDYAVWRPSTGYWFTANPGGDPSVNFYSFPWGLSTDKPQVGDFDGDGRNDEAVFRPSDNIWYVHESLGGGLFAQQFGLFTDQRVPADYNGDGRTDLGVYRDGIWYVSFCPGCPPIAIPFGVSTDTPTPADFDGDGIIDIAVFRPSTGIWYVQGSTVGFFARQWGRNGDVPLHGDFDGDRKSDISVWRPDDGNFYILQSGTGTPFIIHWGQNGDIPVPSFEAQFH